MAYLYETRAYLDEEKRDTIAKIVGNALPDRDFYLLVVGAAIFALFGIALDSIPVLIGSMIVAPLASPILALGLGVVASDMRLLTRSAGTLILACAGTAIVTAIVAHFLPPFSVNGTFISFVAHPFYDIAIALIAGFIATYGHMRVKAGSALTGIGVAVSLMPPLVASALALSTLNLPLFRESALIFVLNVIGILIGSICIFLAFGINAHYRHQKR